MSGISLEVTGGVALLTVDGPEVRNAPAPRMGRELAAPGLPWDAALEFERATQMWSQRRRAEP